MNTKKVVALGLASALTFLGSGVGTVSAATNSGATEVTYINQNHVDGADWAVLIPANVTFTDQKMKGFDFSLTLVGFNGSEIKDFNDQFSVNVSAKSKNGFKLAREGGNEQVEYQVTYPKLGAEKSDLVLDSKIGANKDAVIGKLTKNDIKLEGATDLLKKGTVKGQYKDTVTFTMTPSAESAIQ